MLGYKVNVRFYAEDLEEIRYIDGWEGWKGHRKAFERG